MVGWAARFVVPMAELTKLSGLLQPGSFADDLGESFAELMPVDADVFQVPVVELA